MQKREIQSRREPAPPASSAAAPPTLRQIAASSGISLATVSRVLSGQAARYRISAKTAALVREHARLLNYVPNYQARCLRLKKTLTIGLIIPDISNPFFASIARQVALGARKHNYSVILCDSQDNVELEIQSLVLLRGRNVEGIVLCPVGQASEHLAEFERGGIPIVLVDRYFPERALPFVSSDNFAGAREATEFLIEHGHRRIACLQGLRGTTPNEQRVQGYREALRAHGIPVDETLLAGDSYSEQSGYIETKLLLRQSRRVTAILALSNTIALGAIRALGEEKRQIPKDISLIGFDDQSYSAHLATPLTTVSQPVAEMGEVAVKLLFDQIHTSKRESTGGILLPATLIARKSVKRLA